MKNKSIFLIMLFFQLTIFCSYSQTEIKTENVIISYKKTPPEESIISKQINELTNYDHALTEKVFKELYLKNPDRKISKVYADEEFEKLSETDKKTSIKKTKIIQIINKLKE